MASLTGHWVRTGVVAGVISATLLASTPTMARDGGAIAAGILGGAAVGALVGSAAAGAYAPPPPPPPVYVQPGAYAPPPPPPPCHREIVRVWDPYAGVYVDRPRRVCDGY